MATLNTLRTRGALFLSIFIGVALIAFLLGDLTTASSVFQSRRNRVGQIDGKNIDYMDFVNENESTSQVIQMIYGRSTQSAEMSDQVREMVWQTYIRRFAFEPGYRKLGIRVGEAEQVDMVQGEHISPVVMGLFSDPQTGAVNREAMAGFISSLDLDPTGQTSRLWDYAKNEMVYERTAAKFFALVKAGMFANDLEVAKGVEATNNNYTGSWAQVPYTTIADSLVTVSGADVRAYYNAHRENFRRQASRDVEYVVFDVSPSEEDYAEAQAHVETLASEFAVAEDAMQYASLNSQERTSPVYFRESQLSPENAAIAFGDRRGEMAGPTLSGNIYTMTRVANVRMMPDSVGARQITLPLNDPAADSLVNALRGGADFMELAAIYSLDGITDMGVFPPEAMMENIADALVAARVGEVFTVNSQAATHVVELTYRTAPVQKAQLATITYNVEPSATTEQTAYNGARDFLTVAAGSRENFEKAVTDQGVSRRVATISQNDREVSGMTNSRELVRWSFNSKTGTVSPIFDVDGDYVVAVLTDAKEAGVAKVEDVAQGIATRLRTDKKAETIAAEMAGKNVDAVAVMAGARRGEFADLKMNAFYEAELGVEPAVIGSLASVGQGVASKPVKGYAGVYVVQVSSDVQTSDATDESERVRLEATAETSLSERINAAMTDRVEIVDNRAKFF